VQRSAVKTFRGQARLGGRCTYCPAGDTAPCKMADVLFVRSGGLYLQRPCPRDRRSRPVGRVRSQVHWSRAKSGRPQVQDSNHDGLPLLRTVSRSEDLEVTGAREREVKRRTHLTYTRPTRYVSQVLFDVPTPVPTESVPCENVAC